MRSNNPAFLPGPALGVSKPEEGTGRGDAFAVVRAALYLVIAIVVLGYVIA